MALRLRIRSIATLVGVAGLLVARLAAEFGAFLRDEKSRWAKVVKEAGEKFE